MPDVNGLIKGIETLFKNADGKNQYLDEKCLTLYDLSIKTIEAEIKDPTAKGILLYKCWWLRHECLMRNRANDDKQVSECNFKLRELTRYKPT